MNSIGMLQDEDSLSCANKSAVKTASVGSVLAKKAKRLVPKQQKNEPKSPSHG